MSEDKEFLESVLSELYDLILYKNNNLRNQITNADLDDPDYHDYETCHQLQVVINRISGGALTEREKWLMQQSWNNSKISNRELDTMESWLNSKTEFYNATIENLLANEGEK